LRVLCAMALSVALAPVGAAAETYRAPRTPEGYPDLQGTWTNTSLTMLERPKGFAGLIATDTEAANFVGNFRKRVRDWIEPAPIDPAKPAPPVVDEAPQADFLEIDLNLARIDGKMRSSWIVEPADGKLPFTEAGRKAAEATEHESFEGPEARPLMERCLLGVGSPEGPPMMNTGFNGHYQIVQARDQVAILVEMNHDVRIIRLDRAPHPPSSVTSWMGDSIGHWEGETLVVETTNLNPKSYVMSIGGKFAYSPRSRIVERFTRTAPDRILYEFTVEDPLYFTRPWRAEMPMRAAPGPIYEYACHEGNYSLPNALSGARHDEQQGAAEARPTAP
jgi:hypothetical protein